MLYEVITDVLAKYGDVRGIRIEDDVLVTAAAPEVLTADVPKDAAKRGHDNRAFRHATHERSSSMSAGLRPFSPRNNFV